MMKTTTNETSKKSDWFFECVVFPVHTNGGTEYQNAEIRLYYRDARVTKYTDPTVTLTYQQHRKTDIGENGDWSGYYAEELCTRALNGHELKNIAALFQKMEILHENLNRRGLRVNAPYNDEYRTREALLLVLKVKAIRRDRETGDVISVSCKA